MCQLWAQRDTGPFKSGHTRLLVTYPQLVVVVVVGATCKKTANTRALCV